MRKLLLIIITAAVLLTGCSNLPTGEEAATEIKPDVASYNYSGYYNYLVDQRTGVVYMEYFGERRYGITVMLNADGTPVLASEIGFESAHPTNMIY